MKFAHPCLATVTPGSTAIGATKMDGTSGFQAAGTVPPMPALIGTTRTTTIISKDGGCTKVTGIMKIMAIITMIAISAESRLFPG